MLKRKSILPVLLSFLLIFQNFSIINASAQALAVGSETITSRLSGSNRFDTSLAISQSGWTHASNVIIATGSNFPDALSSAALSKSYDAPIILTEKDSLSQNAINELKRLGASNAYIIGGTGAVGSGVEGQLKKSGISITRLYDNDRYGTSLKIAQQLGVNNGIAVATGDNFPDALSIASIASIKTMPILLSPKQGLNSSEDAYIKDKNVPISYIVGGTGVLDSAMDKEIHNSKRLSGSDRYATNLAIINEFAPDLNFDTVYLAIGNNFPDALSGSALAAKNNAPIILTDKNSISADTLKFLKIKKVKHVVILGGTGAVSQTVENQINSSLVVKVASISLNKASVTLAVGGSDTLTAANKAINWTSSDTNVADVDNTGKVTAKAAGTAIITAATADGNKTACCSVIVGNTVITFKDANLEKAVRQAINKPSGEIYQRDVESITELAVNDKISSLDGIESLINLNYLNLSCTQISDINPITYLKLENLYLALNEITSASNSQLVCLYNNTKEKDFQLDSNGNAVFPVDGLYSITYYIKSNTPFIITDDKLKASYEKAKQVLSSIIKPGMYDFEKEKAIHDYIVLNTKYDYDNYLKNTIPLEPYTEYGVLINHVAVCEGYAEATYLLLNMEGIESMILVSGTMDHAWNIVKIYGNYYYLDVTWDDPVPDESGRLRYDYFNKTDSEMSVDHTWDTSLYPVCNTDSIENIENINASAYQGNAFNLPDTVKALMVDNTYQQAAVKWNASGVDTSKIGTYTFEGAIQGYSRMVYLTVTVQDNPAITFKDKNLEAAIRDEINKPTGTLYKGDVANITDFQATNLGISDISGIENLVNLQKLDLNGNQISNISAIGGLANLQGLVLSNNHINDITVLKGLTNLMYLYLSNNPIKDEDIKSLQAALPDCSITF